MKWNVNLFLIPLILICNQYNLSYVKAIVGQNVQIVGEHEYESIIAICTYFAINESPTGNAICTGTMITHNHAVTSEHCFHDYANEPLLILAESNTLRGGKRRFIFWWMSNDQWTERHSQPNPYQDNDIAVVKLLRSVGQNIIPSQLSNILIPQLTGWEVTIVGWGRVANNRPPRSLRKATVRIISQNECNQLATALQRSRYVIPQTWFCTIVNPYALLDLGDSGGPVFDRNNTILGVNFGNCPRMNDTMHPEQSNAHVAVAYYTNFLTHIMVE